jgi:hypothetical protein
MPDAATCPYPVILCEPAGLSGDTPQWKFWCQHCGVYHHHGGHPDANGEIGHRTAHCYVPTSPFRATGYILTLVQPHKPHPLQDIVWRAFTENDHQDGTSLAYFLAGASIRDRGGNKAYRTVALDVLGCMESQGLLYRENGWWRPVSNQ